MPPLIGIRNAGTAAMIVLAAFLVGACKAVDQTTLRQGLGGHVDLQVGGGFAGVRQHLTIGNDGLVVARDEKRGAEARQQLDPARLVQIKAAFAKIDLREEPIPPRLSRSCADCIQYSVSATIDGARHHATISTGGQETSPYGEVISLLSKILHETLSRSGPTGN